MVISMIPNVNNVFKNPNIIDMRFLSTNIPYNPLINYDWSTTTTSGLRYLKDVGSTPTYNASMYFGRGAYLNGVDQTITVPINTTIQTALKRVNGVVTINETSQTLTNYVISGLGVHKDYYLFTRLLTTAEKESYTNTPELFYAMAQADSTCVLNMPMCETSSTVRNYKTGTDYPIINYTTSVRDNAKNLQYGLQTCKFVRDGLGVIQSASNYLECDGVGYANTGWIPSATEDWSIETVVNLSSAMPTTFAKWFRIDNVVKLERSTGYVNRVNYEAVGVVGVAVGLSTDTSHHIILTTDGNIFIDGILVASGTPSRTNTIYPLVLGAYSRSVLTDYSKDTIKSIHVHQKALTQEEATKAYTDAVNKGLLT